MRKTRLYSYLMVMLMTSCIDRLSYNIKKPAEFGISIDGFVSNQPGPYRVNINRTFDIESKESTKTPVSVRHVILSDDQGTSEELAEIDDGVYETNDKGMQGQIGRVYKLRVELFDGRIYESVPDTLTVPGKMDSLYYSFSEEIDANGAAQYGFDVLINSSKGINKSNHFMWSSTGTFKAETHPELADIRRTGCNPLPNGLCNFLPICSGIRNIGTPADPVFVRVKPCECCICWYKIFNTNVVLSDEYFTSSDQFNRMKVFRVPLSGWIFMFKIYVEVSQVSLTRNSFRFWKAVRDQRNAIGNLFQPVSGKIPGNFVQLSGEESPVLGIFYAAGVSSKSIYITRDGVPQQSMIPPSYIPGEWPTPCVGCISCRELFPNATTVKPPFWID